MTDVLQVGLHPVEDVDLVGDQPVVAAENVQADELEDVARRLLLRVEHGLADVALGEVHDARRGHDEHQADQKDDLRTYRIE